MLFDLWWCGHRHYIELAAATGVLERDVYGLVRRVALAEALTDSVVRLQMGGTVLRATLWEHYGTDTELWSGRSVDENSQASGL